jgi:ribonuclease HI
MKNQIIIYTDGSCLNNPGPGGYGVVLIFGGLRKELSRGFRKTTNNRMELLAVIEAMRALKRTDIPAILHTDSGYVVNAINNKWVFGWQKKGFKNKKNPDLWKQFLEIYPAFNIEFKWVKAHVGIRENERCDELAKIAAENPSDIDQVYESSDPSLFD